MDTYSQYSLSDHKPSYSINKSISLPRHDPDPGERLREGDSSKLDKHLSFRILTLITISIPSGLHPVFYLHFPNSSLSLIGYEMSTEEIVKVMNVVLNKCIRDCRKRLLNLYVDV